MNDNDFVATTTGDSAVDDIDLRQYLQIVRVYWFRVFLLASVFSLIASIVVFSMTPKYSSTATLMIEKGRPPWTVP